MQTLEIISVNLWNIVISLCNLLILFWLFKKFLYKPVSKVLAARQDEIDAQYMAAEVAETRANAHEATWEAKMKGAEEEANVIVKNAVDSAKRREDKILSDARSRADMIIKQAEQEAEAERKSAEEGIRKELSGVSTSLAEKLLNREIKEEDHRNLIDSFIEEIGEGNE